MSFLPPFDLPELPASFGFAAVVSLTGTDGKPRVIRMFPRQGRRSKGEPITPPVVDVPTIDLSNRDRDALLAALADSHVEPAGSLRRLAARHAPPVADSRTDGLRDECGEDARI